MEARVASRGNRTETIIGFLLIAVSFTHGVKGLFLYVADRQIMEVCAAALDGRLRLERTHVFRFQAH